MDWQPIETAPKDGTRILVADTYEFHPDEVLMVYWEDRDGDWLIAGQNDPFNFANKPSHWMPLPDLPR